MAIQESSITWPRLLSVRARGRRLLVVEVTGDSDMNNEIEESAKAVQEAAKATRTGIEATQQLGGYVSRIINEPVEAVVGMLGDRLKFMRAERQLRLADRWREILNERNIQGTLRVVPPKLALPIIENASLEEDDELQDLWANLLASAVDPNYNGKIRSAYIDIVRQCLPIACRAECSV